MPTMVSNVFYHVAYIRSVYWNSNKKKIQNKLEKENKTSYYNLICLSSTQESTQAFNWLQNMMLNVQDIYKMKKSNGVQFF